jgi:hypothetical protein
MLVQTERSIPDWFNCPQKQLTASYWREDGTTFALVDPDNGFLPSVSINHNQLTRVYDLNPNNPGDFGLIDYSEYGFKLIRCGQYFKRLKA